MVLWFLWSCSFNPAFSLRDKHLYYNSLIQGHVGHPPPSMQPLLNLSDCNTSFSSSFFHAWRKRMLYAWAQHTPLKWTRASLWKAAILAEHRPELLFFFYKGRRCTDSEHECVSFQGALTRKLNKSTSVFNTQQLRQETHTGAPLLDQMSTRQPQNDTRRAADHMTHSNQCEEGADVSMKGWSLDR